MKIRVRALANLREIIGGLSIIEVEYSITVRRLIDLLSEKIGPHVRDLILDNLGSSLLPYIKIFVNGRDIEFLKGLDTVLMDGDEVVIIPPAGGG